MPIKRCPYCHSMIDERDRFCNSCGTQLLFPEDENVEEDIPGDRITEAEGHPLEEELVLKAAEPGPASKPDRLSRDLSLDFSAKEKAEEEDKRKFLTRELPEMGLDLEAPASGSLKTKQPEARQEGTEQPAGDFDSGFPTSKEEMEEIARLMSSLDSKKKAPGGERLETHPDDVPIRDKDLTSLRFEEEQPPDAQAELPPWAERVKEGVTPGFRASTQEEPQREPGDLALERETGPAPSFPADGGGERIFSDSTEFSREEMFEEDRPFLDGELRPRRRKRGRGILSRLKARVYDILFITLFWAAALWVSSRILATSIFDIVQTSGLQVGIFYLILFVGYFALFLSFLGETLGDRLSSPAR